MNNRLESVDVPASLLHFQRRQQEDGTPSRQQNVPQARNSDALALGGPSPERLERPPSRRIGNASQALAAIEKLRRQATEHPTRLLASHAPDGRLAETLLTRAPAS